MLFLIILILSLAASYFLPWWMIAVIAFLAAYFFGKTSWYSFWSAFGAVFIIWTALALLKSIPNDNILAGRVIQLFFLHSWIWLLIITGLVGGLVSGMAALSGALLKKAFAK
jgi:hypothetical protein